MTTHSLSSTFLVDEKGVYFSYTPRRDDIDIVIGTLGPIAPLDLCNGLAVSMNAGAIDDYRALNYLAVRYPAIYAAAAEAYGRNASLTGVEVRPSRLAGARKIVDVIFAYTNRDTDVTERFFVRVDVTEEFLFLVTKLSPYFER